MKENTSTEGRNFELGTLTHVNHHLSPSTSIHPIHPTHGSHPFFDTCQESVRGFRLVSLERLSQMSSARKQQQGVSSLMHFLVLTISNTQPHLLTFADDLQHVDYAAKSK